MNNDLVGKEVLGIWGAMFPYSHGKIVKANDTECEIEWANDDEPELGNQIEPISQLRLDSSNEIGIYIKL